MATAQRIPETLSQIEEKLQTLEKHRKQITTAKLVDLLSLIQEYEITDEIRGLLGEKISSQKADLLYTLRNTPHSIQRPIERATRVENAKKKVDLLISFITKFIEKIEKLDSKEYKLYTVKEEHEPNYFAMTKRGNENIGGKFLGRKYDIQELESKRNDIVVQLQSIKSSLNTLNRLVSVIDTNNNNKEEQVVFNELREKIFTQEEKFLQIYDNFARLIIPTHIADSIDTEKLYQEEEITAQIQQYLKGKYGPHNNKDETIPDGIDPDSLDYQEKIPLQKLKTELQKYPLSSPLTYTTHLKLEMFPNSLTIEQIEYIPLQYPMDEHLSYSNPEYKKAQKIREKYKDPS